MTLTMLLALIFFGLVILPLFIFFMMMIFGETDKLIEIINAIRDAIIAIIEANKKRKNGD